jgi:hypothetical protein
VKPLVQRAVVTGVIASTLGFMTVAGDLAYAASSITDRQGDTTDDYDRPLSAPRADITAADAQRAGGNVVFRSTTAEAVNPLSDPNWSSGDSWMSFMLDVNGDGKSDFDVEYGVEKGVLYVDVYKEDGSDEPPIVCRGTPGFDGGYYVATVAARCLGNPIVIGFRAENAYDTNATGEDGSPIAYDSAPDSGFAGPV